MAKRKDKQEYLLFIYSRVDKFLSKGEIAKEELPDSIVSFCIVVEKVLKIKLHRKNPLLVFDGSNIKNDDLISRVALKKEVNISTARIENIINRFLIVFKNIFTAGELQALTDIYEVRNCFVHGYKSDEKIVYDPEDIVKKMGTIWVKISKIAFSLFVNKVKNTKPKKKYTENELEQVLESEVIKMIKPSRRRFGEGIFPETGSDQIYSSVLSWSRDKCPRCGSQQFSLGDNRNDWMHDFDTIYTGSYDNVSNLYKCKRCNLELTEKQYEIAKKILDRSQ